MKTLTAVTFTSNQFDCNEARQFTSLLSCLLVSSGWCLSIVLDFVEHILLEAKDNWFDKCLTDALGFGKDVILSKESNKYAKMSLFTYKD